jgi:hypothetical protein
LLCDCVGVHISPPLISAAHCPNLATPVAAIILRQYLVRWGEQNNIFFYLNTGFTISAVVFLKKVLDLEISMC